MTFVNPYNVLVGRLTSQAYISTLLALELTDKEGDYLVDAAAIGGWTIATFAIWKPVVYTAAKGAAVVAAVNAAAAVAEVTVAPVALGYAAGAVTGTLIVDKTFQDPTATQMALDLYTNPDVLSEGGILYETADMLGNAKIIGEHLWENRRSPGKPYGWHWTDDLPESTWTTTPI